MIYVGSSEQNLNFDFFGKVANSSVENTLKLYTNSIDVNSPPPPTDASWKEVTDQKIIDKVKIANETVITSVNTANRTAIVGGETLVSQGSNITGVTNWQSNWGTIANAVHDDFVGKTSGDTTSNPNMAKVKTGSLSLLAPSAFGVDVSQSAYNLLATLNGSSVSISTSILSEIPQMLLQWNIIAQIESKYGTIPSTTDLASKIAWAKANISTVTCNAYIYGSSPLGSKAYFQGFYNNSSWAGSLNNNATSSSLLQLIVSNTNIPYYIDSNGFVSFLAYSDAARTTDSTFLVMTNHGLRQWDLVENTTRSCARQLASIPPSTNTMVVSAVAGQVAGDNINKFQFIQYSYAGAGTTTTTLIIPNHGLSTGDWIGNVNRNSVFSKVTVVDANTLTCQTAITNQTSGDKIALFHYCGQQTAESTVIPSTIYCDYVSLDIQLKPTAGYDLLVPQNPRRDSVINGNFDEIILLSKVYGQINKDFTSKTAGDTTGNPNIAKYMANTALQSPNATYTYNNAVSNGDFSNGTTGWLANGGSITVSNNTLTLTADGTSSAPQSFREITATSILSHKIYMRGKAMVTNSVCNSLQALIQTRNAGSFVSNIAVQVLSNPTANTWYTLSGIGTLPSSGVDAIRWEICDYYSSLTIANGTVMNVQQALFVDLTATFGAGNEPSSAWCDANLPFVASSGTTSAWAEVSQTNYTQLATLDNSSYSVSTNVNGVKPQELYQWNLIRAFEDAYGTIPTTGTDVTSKVNWLKSNINTVRYNWYGYGSCSTGNKCYTRVYDYQGNGWGGTIITNTSTTPYLNSYTYPKDIISNNVMDSNGIFTLLAYADSSDGTTASTIYCDYVQLQITFTNSTNAVEYFTNNSVEVNVLTNNKASSYMISIDETPLVNSIFSSSNANLKSAFKTTSNFDVYAVGTGSNSGSLADGVNFYAYNGTSWINLGSNLTSAIVDTNCILNSSDYINSNNCMYLLVVTKFPSDATIPSSLSLDYIQANINLTRLPDIPSPEPITL